MSSRLFSLVAALFACVVLIGCPGPASEPTSESGSSTGGTETSASEAGGFTLETDEGDAEVQADVRKSTDGRWLLTIMQGQQSIPGMLLDLKDGEPAALVVFSDSLSGWAIASSTVTADSVAIECTNTNGDPVSIEASLAEDGVMRGSAAFGVSSLNYVALTATDKDELTDVAREPLPAYREYAGLVQSKPSIKPDEIKKFADELPATPVKVSIYQQLLQLGMQVGLGAEQLIDLANGLVAAAEPWGPKLEARQLVFAILSLSSNSEVPAETLRSMADRAGSYGDGDKLPEMETAILIARASAAIRDDKTPANEATPLLERLQADLPFESITYDLRSALAERSGDKEEQLAIAVEQLVIPGANQDSKAVEELYATVHGSTDGYQELVEQTYDSRLTAFASEPLTGLGKTPVVIELFTGTSCPPCVAADVALHALEKNAPDNVHVLRYHLDIPAPDPLATKSGESRFGIYDLRGTPGVVVNGVSMQIPGMAGSYAFAETGYERLVSLVQSLSNAEPGPVVEVEAVQAGDIVRVRATASDIPSDQKANLFIALAEESIDLVAPNGIREHGMVVRALPAGPVGTVPPNTASDADDVADEENGDSAPTESGGSDEPASETAPTTSDDASGSEEDGESDAQSTAEDTAANDTEGDASVTEDAAVDGAAKVTSLTIVTETSLADLKESLKSNLRIPEEQVAANLEAITDLGQLWAFALVQDARTGAVITSGRTRVVTVKPQAPKDEAATSENPAAEGAAAAKATDSSAETGAKPDAKTAEASIEKADEPASDAPAETAVDGDASGGDVAE